MALVVDDGRYVYGSDIFFAEDGEPVQRLGTGTTGITLGGQFVTGLPETSTASAVSLVMDGDWIFGSSVRLTESGSWVFQVTSTMGLTESGDHAFLAVEATGAVTYVERGIRGVHRGVFNGGFH